MIDTYIKEFYAISKHLLENKEKAITTQRYIIVKKEILLNLLNQNMYEIASNKLKNWKKLNWIDTDEDRVTKRVTINKKTVAAIKIYLSVYEALKEINGD